MCLNIILILFLKINLSIVFATHLIRFSICPLPYVCKPINECQTFVSYFGKQSYCGLSLNSLKVCCFTENISTTSIRTTRATSALRVIRKNKEISNHKNLKLLPNDKCGQVSNHLRIISGSSTSPGEFPWMALIAYKTENSSIEDRFKCAGTIINEKFILTAAHCINNLDLVGVRLGEYNLKTDIDCDSNGQHCEPPVQDLLINKTIIYPFYDPSNFINDIALIKLATSVSLVIGHSNIIPICLPFGEHLDLDFDEEQLTVAGWGITETGEKSTTLKKVSVPVVSTEQCQKFYEDIMPITNKQICAGADHGRDACSGDSGGPLKKIVYVDSVPRWVQYGIVSYGPKKCGLVNRPGIYTNVKKYMKWILDNLE